MQWGNRGNSARAAARTTWCGRPRPTKLLAPCAPVPPPTRPPPSAGVASGHALAGLACSGPFVVFPGGSLDGQGEPAPADWAFAGDFGTIQLETRPEDPYSVNIAFTVVNGALFVNAGDTETQWVKNMTANPLVRLRMDGVIYDLRAERVTDVAEITTFAKAWTSQSMFRRDPAELDEVFIYRLVAR